MASPTKGWGRKSPRTEHDRQRVLDKCGRKCFLVPSTKKYPICGKIRTMQRSCIVDCRATLVAYARARQRKNFVVANKAKQIAKRNKCGWVD